MVASQYCSRIAVFSILTYILFFCFENTGFAVQIRPKPKIYNIVYFRAVSFSSLRGWRFDNHYKAFKAFSSSCEIIRKKQSSQPIGSKTQIGGKALHWQRICAAALKSRITNKMAARRFFEKWFALYEVRKEGRAKTGKITGYYQIQLNGSRRPSKRYAHPVYRTPPNISEFRKNKKLSRAQIDRGMLKNKGLEIAWVDSKAKLFFMQIQGTGRIKMAEGGTLCLSYANQNGFPYTDITPYIKKYTNQGLGATSAIVQWMEQNPRTAELVMRYNQSYVFFGIDETQMPRGAHGVALMSERSIAVDNKIYPLGTPIWVESTLPKNSCHSNLGYSKLTVAQDTGGSIKGPLRADVFFGYGKCAEEVAGKTNSPAMYYALFPKSVHIPKYYRY